MYGPGAHQLLGWLRETNWRENERAALLAAKASVEPNQVFEGRTLVSDLKRPGNEDCSTL